MEAKLIEIRDSATFIPAVAVKLTADSAEEQYLLSCESYDILSHNIILCRLADGSGSNDPYGQTSRTMMVAHSYIEEHFDEIVSGDVVDVEFILGITDKPKLSERITVAPCCTTRY